MAGEIDHLLKAAFELIDAGDVAPSETVHIENRDFRVIGDRHEQHGWVLMLVEEPERVPSDFRLEHMYGLTERQAAVARYLIERLSNQEIADRLGVTEGTAGRHVERVMTKIGVSSRKDVRAKLMADRCAG